MDKNYIISDTSFKISSFAVQAMLYEVSCFPSPGLVSCISNGAHKDMNFYTFVDSTSALIKYLTLCVQTGLEGGTASDTFEKLKKLGISAEKEMFEKTEGVNTQKGMVFLMGICCGAAGLAIRNRQDFYEIHQIIKDMTFGIVERELYPLLTSKENIKDGKLFGRRLSYGEKLFLEYDIRGIRGEVEKGLPLIFHYALDFYKENMDMDKNSRLVHTLIGIMQFSNDTNIVHRHSQDILKEVNKRAVQIMNVGGMRTEQGRMAIELLDKEFTTRNISPGGTADLLAITVFLSLVEQYMNGTEKVE
jgi:triphosphoribosyl-dephospho-CoA synthase